MSQHNITVEGGKSVRLPTAGKYCDRDIMISATGGGVPLPTLTNPGTEDDLMQGKELIDGAGAVVKGAFTLDSELSDQDLLLEQIREALVGKAAGEGESTPTQEKNVTITQNGSTEILPDEGYALHKVGVTVDVPIPDGYIQPSGTKSITANGTHDAKAFESVSVNVPIPEGYIQPSGTKEITGNGTHDVTAYASVNVNVAASGGDPKALLDAALSNTLTAIDSTVTSVVAYACRGLSKLKTVNIPNATSIGTYAFYYCTAMSSLNAPNATSLGTYALYNCDALTSVNFPKVTAITQNSLYSCGKLKKADFGAASSIATSAFAYCEALTTLILRRTSAICTLSNKNAFTGTPIEDGTGYVYVPAALLSNYTSASNWSTYAAQIRAIEDYPEITGG